MPATFDSQRLRIVASTQTRYKREIATIGRNIGDLVARAATDRTPGGDALVPDTMRSRVDLKAAIWQTAIKPYFIGQGNDPFRNTDPQSPFARTLYDGIAAVTRLQARRQIAILRRVVKDDVVFRWLTGPRPVGFIREVAQTYDPFHLFVDPKGYRLSDRIWRDSIDVRSRVDALLDYEIGHKTSATRLAKLIESFLTPGASVGRTQKPYGSEGSFSALRLARTEITAAAGRATVNASQANPFVGGVRWMLSRSHKEADQCDANASGGPNGDGVYPPGDVPTYPDHPQCLCTLVPVPAGDVSDLIASLRKNIEAAGRGLSSDERTQVIRGMFGEDFMTRGLLDGSFQEAAGRLRLFGERVGA